jgi:hypothetical protein
VVTGLWILLFRLNHWLFSTVVISQYISWVFLPAALRVLAVLLLEWRGVQGLFWGALFTHSQLPTLNEPEPLILALISSLAPMLAIRVSARFLGVQGNLAGLTFAQLALMSLMGALISSVTHNLYFHWHFTDHTWLRGIAPMLIGDMIGTLIVLYVCAVVLRRLRLAPPP